MDDSNQNNAEIKINTTAILFGNIDKKGQLESDDQDFVCLNKLEDCQLEEFNDTINALLTSQDENNDSQLEIPTQMSSTENLKSEDFYDENEALDVSEFENKIVPNRLNNTSVDDYDDCMIVDDSSVKMPPPSEMPCVLQSRKPTCDLLTSLESPIDRTNGLISCTTPQNENVNHLSTPLGSILPPEYMNVDIRSLFPHYHSEKIPRWSKLFKTFDEHQLYRPLDNLKSSISESSNTISNTPHPNNATYYFNSFDMNLGEEAPANMILPNDAELLRQPAKSFEDCAIPVPYRDMQPCADYTNISNNLIIPNIKQQSNTSTIPVHNNHNINNKLPLPPLNTNNNQQNHQNNLNNNQNSYNRRMKMQQDAVASRKKRKRDEKSFNRRNGGEEQEYINRDELLIGLTWRDGPSRYWYDMYNIPLDTNIIDYKINCPLNNDDTPILPSINIESLESDCKYYSWQLFHWENDIIVDPSNFKKEVFDGNRKYAPYAGWIPSFKQRTINSFQDVFAGDYFGICSSSATGTNIQRPTADKWHSIFALENVEIIKSDWVRQIITDPRQVSAQEPCLLELDLNNEHIHFDFTNCKQTTEILTSELNDVCISNPISSSINNINNVSNDNINNNNLTNTNANPCGNNSNNSTISTNTTSTHNTNNISTIDKSTDQPHPVESQKDEKQIKKLKILSKYSDGNEVDEKPTEQNILSEPIDVNDSFKMVQYIDNQTYQPFHDQSEANFFFLDPVLDFNSSTLPDNNSSGNNVLSTANDCNNTDSVLTPLVAQGIQHSLPAVKLDPHLYPLKVDNQYLRFFHRPRFSDFKHYVNHLLTQPLPIYNLKEILKMESDQRDNIAQMTGNGDLFFMRTISDLSATIDHIILAEYSEEYPPLLSQTGMASQIINYFCGNPKQPVIMPQLHYGQLFVSQQIPFLGQLQAYQLFQALENNMFRAPIYPHKMKSNDFLVILKPNSINIRRVDDIFTVGQQLPIVDVPAPNSKKANTFLKDFLQVQIIRLFLQSSNEPKQIRHDEIKMIFSEQSDSALKKRLKTYAEYKKAEGGNSGGYWVLKPEFQLPTEDELLECITPEECCSYYSMMWGLCRLEDAGYNSRSLIQTDPDQQDDDEKDSNLKIEDEVKAAPWHTTKTLLDSQKGKCYLELNGATDPTGIGEGFSYSRVSTKASLFKEPLRAKVNNNKASNNQSQSGTMVPGVGKRMVTGTDADLRKLTLKKAHALLKDCGVSEQEFKKLKRWDIIWMVREMSNQKAKQGEEEGMIKFARSSRLTVADQEEKYRSECQRIFDLQNKVLSNTDELTSDEGGSDDDELEPSASRIGHNTTTNNNNVPLITSTNNANNSVNPDDRLTSNNFCNPSSSMVFDNSRGGNDEDLDVLRIRKSMDSGRRLADISETNSLADLNDNSGNTNINATSSSKNVFAATTENARAILKLKPPVPKVIPKALCIRRYIDNGDGTKTMKPQTIPWSSIVKIYFKMNEEHKTEFLKDFCGLNKSKEEEKKLRKKQQEQMRRIKRQQKQKLQAAVAANTASSSMGIGNSATMTTASTNMMDSANPIKKKYRTKLQQKQQAVKLKQQQHQFNQISTGSTVAGISCGACGNKGHMRTNKECPNYGKPIKKSSYKRPYRPTSVQNTKNKTIHQLLTSAKHNKLAAKQHSNNNNNSNVHYSNLSDPNNSNIDLSNDSHHVEQFPNVNDEYSKDSSYLDYNQSNPQIQPMDDDDSDLKLVIPKTLISQYSSINNLSQDSKSKSKRKPSKAELARQLSSTSSNTKKSQSKQFNNAYMAAIKQNEYMVEQKMKGNRRRIDPKVALNHQFEEIYKGFLQISGYRCFLHPVRKRDFPNYYDIIMTPMDLSTVKMNINENHYQTRESFLQDIKLIYENCIQFNGDNHDYTVVARQLISHVMEQFCAKERKLMRLERLVNPLMDEDDMVGMKFILEQTVASMEEVEHSRPFHVPVDKKKYPDYFDKISTPMDLSTLRVNIKSDRYRSRGEFLSDAALIQSNCAAYNGQNSLLTRIAEQMLDVARAKFAENETTLISLESNLLREDVSDSQVGASSCVTDHLSHIGEDNEPDNASSVCFDDSTTMIVAPTGTESLASVGNHGEQILGSYADYENGDKQNAIVLPDDDDDNDGNGIGGAIDKEHYDLNYDREGMSHIHDNTEPSNKRIRLSSSTEDNSGGDGNGVRSGGEGGGPSLDANRERIMADLHLTDSEDEDDDDNMHNHHHHQHHQQQQHNHHTSSSLNDDVVNLSDSDPNNDERTNQQYQQHHYSNTNMSDNNTDSSTKSASNVKFYIGDD